MKPNFFERPVFAIEKDFHNAGEKLKTFYKFTDIDEFPKEEIYNSMRWGYEQKDLYSRVLSMIINGTISSCKTKFLVSKKTLIHNFQADPNISISSLRGDQYAYIRDMLSKSGLFRMIVEGDANIKLKKGEKREMKARAYEVIDPTILNEIERNKRRFK